MTDDASFVLTLVTALGCGLVGGVFFAFSSFVMRALARLPPAQGIAAMQSINVAVINGWFLTPFVGTAVACVVLAAVSLAGWGESDAVFALIGSGLYLLGSIGVTAAFNIPRNDALAAVEAESADGARRWSKFVPSWTAWNTARTAASVGAAVFLMIALVSS
jgi:uncharacterized membrane protein